ncbi:MAG: TonB-dependent receptor [Bacteroidota bacterium]
MKIRNCILQALLLLPFCGYSQTFTQTVRGTVLDADSKSPIPDANVAVLGLDSAIGATTDAEGKFRLEKVPVGRRSIKVSFIGYEDAVLNNVVIGSGKEVVLEILLYEMLNSTGEILITPEKDKTKANNDLVTNSSRNFQSEETERYAGSRGDPSKMVANYAGVATGNDANNSIIVRGNSPLGVLWRLEGVDIPNPNHFSTQGATGGPVSILNNNLLGASDFLTGAFPAEYGNKYAAVFDLKLRNGNNEKHEFMGQMGFNGLEAGIEGPLFNKNGSSFLVNYRYSTLELFDLMGISFGVSAIPRYQDLCFKLNMPTGNAGVFSVWGITGLSNISLLDSEKDTADWSFTSSGEDLVFTSQMGATGLTHTYFFNDKVSGRFSLSASGSKFRIDLDTLSADKKPFRVYRNVSIDQSLIAAYALTWKINAHHLIKTGINHNQMFFDYTARYWSRYYTKFIDELNEKDNAGLAQGYVHWQYRCTDKLTFNTGLHWQYFFLNGSQAIEPRLGMRWAFAEKQALSLAYGMHSQTQPLIYYFFKRYDENSGLSINNTRNLGFTKSHHLVAGYDFNFMKDFRMKLETYYQYLYDIPVEQYAQSSFSLINLGNDLEGIPLVDSLHNKGTGYNYGVELTIEKFFSNGYYFLSSLSLYDSWYKGSDGKEHHTAFAGGYVYNLLGGIELPLGAKKNRILAFDVKMTFAGGNRYTPLDIPLSIQEKSAVYIDSLAYSGRFKDYQKVDFKVSFKSNKKRSTQSFFINIENIFNRRNVLRQVWDDAAQSTREEYQLGLFPYAGYRIEF